MRQLLETKEQQAKVFDEANTIYAEAMAIKKKYESGAHEDGGMKTKMTQETSDLPASALLGTAEVTTPSNVAWKTKAHDGEIYCCTFNTLGDTLVTGGADKKVKLWNVNTGKNVQTV